MVAQIRIPPDADRDLRASLLWRAAELLGSWQDSGLDPTVTIVTADDGDIFLIKSTPVAVED
jgi:hypothetical protein